MFDTMLASFVISIYLYLHKYKLQYFGILITFYHMAAISLNMSGPILIYNLTTGPYLLIPIYQIANFQVSTCHDIPYDWYSETFTIYNNH